MALFPENMLQASELSLETIAQKLLYFQEQLHMIHWQTNGYAEHKATGEMYEYIQDFRDGIIEKLMGYCGRKISMIKPISLVQTDSNNIAVEMSNWAKDLKRYAEINSYLDIGNLADEFSGQVSKFKYLLTLS